MNSLKKLLKRYNELWLAPLAIILFIIAQSIVKIADPEAVPYTIDAVQKIIFGHLVFACCTISVWLSLRLTWPGIFKYLVDHFNQDFVNLNDNQRWEKLKLSFWVFACYLLGLILCMQVL